MFSVSRPLGTDLARVGWVAAAVMAILTIGWIASLILIPGPPAELDPGAKLRYLSDHPERGTIGPAFVAGLALLHVPVWLGLAAVVWSRRPAAGLLAVAFGLVYAPLASINYWTQLTVVRGLADLERTDPTGAATAYRLFEFPGGLASFAYGIDVLAYVVWGIAALAAAVGLLALDGRLAGVTAGLFAAGGTLAVVGGFGFVLQIELLELGVLLSGVAFLLGIIAAAALLHRAASMGGSLLTGVSLELRLGSRP